MTDLTTPKPSDTPRRRLSMSFKVASKVLLDNISDDDSDNDDSGKNSGGKTLVSIEQQQQQQNQHQQKKLTDEQLSELYKREIKLCTDKKITLENAWQFSLLDNMSVANSIFTPKHRKDKQQAIQSPQKSPRRSNIHLRFSETAAEDDTETNFQMASTVIEAGATVYSMRVQSLYTETDKMRDKLAASNKKLAARGNDDSDSEAERIFAGADDGDSSAKKGRRKAAASTLTTDDKICARGLDTNLEPDPLFNKDTEIYMLGGCQRLLLGRADTLAGRTILLEPTRDDAVDLCALNRRSALSRAKKGGNDSDDDEDNSEGAVKKDPFDEGDMPIERGCLASLVPVAVNTIELCPMIREYSWDAVFGPSKVPDIEISDAMESPLADDLSEDPSSLPLSLPPPPTAAAEGESETKDEIFEGVAPAEDDNDRDDDIGFMGAIDVDDDMAGNENGNANISSTPPIGTDASNDAAIPGKSLIDDENSNASLNNNNNNNNNNDNANGTNEDYFFFDPKLMLNWAGPDHWKFPTLQKAGARRASEYDADGELNGDPADQQQQQPPAKKRARKKEGAGDGCFIDFTSQAKFDPKLFEPPAKTSTTLSDAALKKHTALATTLPPDIHYDVSMLSRLFLNPSWQFSERRNPAQSAEARRDASGDLERMASQEWYEYNSQPVGPDGDGLGGPAGGDDEDDEDNAGFGMPSSFGDDSIGGIGGLGSVVGGSQAPILTTLIAAPPQLKIGHVNFTKEMRVVDVGLIKRTLWKHLSEPPEKKEDEKEDEKEKEKKKEKESGEVTKSFKEILTEISNDLPNDTMEDLTVSFCFMCVLHLCNEKSMHITVDKDTNDLIIHRPKDN